MNTKKINQSRADFELHLLPRANLKYCLIVGSNHILTYILLSLQCYKLLLYNQQQLGQDSINKSNVLMK